jgi:hypothetical protein
MNRQSVSRERGLELAIHILHEQVHGQIPFRTCMNHPCRQLSHDTDISLTGPAPATLPIVSNFDEVGV